LRDRAGAFIAKGFRRGQRPATSRSGSNDKEILCTPTIGLQGLPEGRKTLCVRPITTASKFPRPRAKAAAAKSCCTWVVYKHNPAIQRGGSNCHPTGTAHGPSAGRWRADPEVCAAPKSRLVFLGEVPIAIYETPGSQKVRRHESSRSSKSATTIIPGRTTAPSTFGPDLEKGVLGTRKLSTAYCKILILARQLGQG